jgi:ABC-2 type transport system ATP-binding protein
VLDVFRSFDAVEALAGVSLAVRPGEVHALLGPNGAGKTTLLRLLTGLLTPTTGTVAVAGRDPARDARRARSIIGLVPAGERTLYLRLTGLQNLVFFGRMHGLGRREALARADEALAAVGLSDAARRMAGHYSHGMQKRLSFARALLTRPVLLLVDEATHDLDPEAAATARDLVTAAALGGAGVLWTTQRVEEVRGFADRVTVLARGRVAFAGGVPELLAHAAPRRYLVRLRRPDGGPPGGASVTGLGTLQPAPGGGPEDHLLILREETILGDALARLTVAGIQVLACREERPEVEDAFLTLTRDRAEAAA